MIGHNFLSTAADPYTDPAAQNAQPSTAPHNASESPRSSQTQVADSSFWLNALKLLEGQSFPLPSKIHRVIPDRTAANQSPV